MKPIYYLIHSFSFGDTLAATPTLRYLSQSHEQKINVVTKKPIVFKNNPWVNDILSFDEFEKINTEDLLIYESFVYAGRTDKNGFEKKFSHIDLRQLHARDLGFELLPHQMEYDFFPDPVGLPEEIPSKFVVCHITQNWPNRTWSTDNWQKLIDWLSMNKIFTVLIGQDHSETLHTSVSSEPLIKACPKLENLYGLDLTNVIELEMMYEVISKSSVLITMDTGPLHIAGCTDTHILQLGSATHPLLRIPYRNNTQNYKYDFVGGSCNIFCNSDLKYNVREWGHINAVAPLTDCSENKPTFECHPSVEKVIDKLSKILGGLNEKTFSDYIEFLSDEDRDAIIYNYKIKSDDDFQIVIRDVNTGLYRDRIIQKPSPMIDGYYWWAPQPGKVKGLGDIDLYFYLNEKHIGTKRLNYEGGSKLIVNNQEIYSETLLGTEYPTFWEVFVEKEYERHSNCLVEQGDVVLDIGANYGYFGLDCVNKGAYKIYCVEPYIKAYENLCLLSEKFPIINPLQKAISDKTGSVEMFVDYTSSATNCVTKYGEMFYKNTNTVEVESININELISSIEEKINFLKVDCEGSEFELFSTITEKNLQSIDKIIIETHGEEIDKFVFNKLIQNNFEVDKHEHILYAVNKNKVQ